MHTFRRGKMTDYGIHLREKQKVKNYYGVLETQFRRYFQRAERSKGNTGTVLMSLLERRLDNIVHRMGFAPSRRAARQLVTHRHVEVNGKRVDIPSYRMRSGDEVSVKEKSREMLAVKASLEGLARATPMSWISVDSEKTSGKITEIPTRDTIPVNAQEQLIVELYSK